MKSNSDFYYARFSRIYPVYLLAFIFDLPRGIGYYLETHSYGKIVNSSISHITMLQSWHPRLATVYNSPAWSLSIEAFFYLVFPFVLPYILKTRKNLVWISYLYLIPLLIFSTMTRLMHFNLSVGIHEVFWRTFPLIRVFEFLIGIYLGKLYVGDHKFVQTLRIHSRVSGILFWVLAIGSLLIFTQNLHISKSVFPNLILVPVFSLMILILTSVDIPMAFLLRNRLMLFLGSSSYALYIFHCPMEPYIEALTNILPVSFTGSTLMIYLIAIFLVSIVIYKFVEIPAQRYLRQKTFWPRK